MPDFWITEGDLLPEWETTLNGPDGAPLDLTGATVTLLFDLLNGKSLTTKTRACEVDDRFVGAVRVAWEAEDTPLGSAGFYNARFSVVLGSGKPLTVPGDWPLLLEIRKKSGG